MVEREIAGFGPSGRNGGWCRGGMSGVGKVYAKRSGWDAVKRGERDTQDAVDVIGSVIAEEAIDCGYNKQGAVLLAENEAQMGRLRGDLADFRALGLDEQDVRLLSPAEVREFVRVPQCAGGMFEAAAARLNPAELSRGLADACERRGVRIFEQTEGAGDLGGQGHHDPRHGVRAVACCGAPSPTACGSPACAACSCRSTR